MKRVVEGAGVVGAGDEREGLLFLVPMSAMPIHELGGSPPLSLSPLDTSQPRCPVDTKSKHVGHHPDDEIVAKIIIFNLIHCFKMVLKLKID